MTMGDRVKRRRQELGISVKELAKTAGISATALYDLERGDTDKSTSTAALAYALGVNALWLEEGRGPKLAGKSNVEVVQAGTRRVPVISHVQAGNWLEAADPYAPGYGEEQITTDVQLSGNGFALRLRGNSMEPGFAEGDMVIIDPGLSPLPGDFVVAKNGSDEATFKKYRPRGRDSSGREVFELVPLNPDYATLRSDQEPITIVGVMVEHRRYRKRSRDG